MLAPVYDLVTTTVYLPQDRMALALNGSTKWPSAKELQRLGETRIGGAPGRIRQILERIGDALAATSADVNAYIGDHPEFLEVGTRISAEWEKGIHGVAA